MRDYNFTLGELLDQFNYAASTLKGKNPFKEDGGLKEMVNRAVADLELDLEYYNIVIRDCRVYVDTIDFGEIEIVNFHPEYKPDKRKMLGKGDYLQEVRAVLKREIPLDMEIVNLTQMLSYDVAKERKERMEKEIAEFEKEIAERKTYLQEMEKIMKRDNYK